MGTTNEFDEIRPYHNEELAHVFEELIADEDFRKMTAMAMPEVPFETIASTMRQCKTINEFQRALCYSILHKIADTCSDGISLDHSSLADKSKAYTYISNHRDIILDSGFLSILLVDQGMDTVEIAIGDNLLIYPWIKKLVRINKSVIVQRSLGMRQMLESSQRLSKYIHYAINEKKQSLWIAQREGRAKDSNDRTQDSLLKMLAMGGEGTITERLKDLHIAPLSISYEYDPCDYLKAKEFQLKRDNPNFKKSQADDLLNMGTGLKGYKGRVHFCTGQLLDNMLDQIDQSASKQEQYTQISTLIDREIHRNYRLYPGNYIAADMLGQNSHYANQYNDNEKKRFVEYLEQQLAKIELPHKDEIFLRNKMLAMYANPLLNHLASLS